MTGRTHFRGSSWAATPPDGTQTEGGDLHTATVTVSPAPATGSNVDVEGFCDGVSVGTIATLQTNAAGQVVFSEVLPGVLDCGSQLELREYRLRFAFEGQTTDCFWNVRIS